MIKKLRKRLILTSMVSLMAVLAIIEGTVGVLNYQCIVEDADGILAVLGENGGRFPEAPSREKKMPSTQKGNGRLASPEIPYESRFFSALLDSEGNVISTDTGKIASIDTSSAMEYAQAVWKNGKKQGFAGDYRYLVSPSGEDTRIIFLDCGRSLSSFRSLIWTCLAVTMIGLLTVLILITVLSARIVKPFSENYEKQKRFVTDAGHELKTPLTIISADAEVLEMDIGENEWIRDIQAQTKRMAGLTNDLILLSRMEENQTESTMAEIPLSEMAEETVGMFQALAVTQNKSLTSNISPMLSMWGDAKEISRLLVILLDNAVKYCGEGGQISLTLEKQKKRIRLCVFNTTEFISREQLPRLFDRFYRADSSRNSQTGGYGLGLSIAAAIVNVHKGKITASTEDERSLLITVTFSEQG